MLTLYLEEWTHVILAHSFNVADKERAEKANKRHVEWLDVAIQSTDRKPEKEPNSLILTQIYTYFLIARGNWNIRWGVFDSLHTYRLAWAYYRHNYGL